MYPDRYRLPEVTAGVLARLERRRPGHGAWSETVGQALVAEAGEALADMGRQFAEVADDPGYWRRVEESVLKVAVPRYLQAAERFHALELRDFDLWRGGDLVSRGVYALVGVIAAILVWRIPALPLWLEPLPVGLIAFGPLLPDLQVWWYRRRYGRRLSGIVEDMEDEQRQLEAYRPLSELVDLPRRELPPE